MFVKLLDIFIQDQIFTNIPIHVVVFVSDPLGLRPIRVNVTDSLTDSLTPSGRFVEVQTVTHFSLMLGLSNFNKTSLTIRQLMSGDLTYLFQLLKAVISC